MSEQTKLEADIPALRASIESLYGLTDDGDMLLIDCVPDLLDALDELERLRAERPGWREDVQAAIGAINAGHHERAIEILRALHPSVAEGRQPKGRDYTSLCKTVKLMTPEE